LGGLHVIQTRSSSRPVSCSPQYSCSRMNASSAAPRASPIGPPTLQEHLEGCGGFMKPLTGLCVYGLSVDKANRRPTRILSGDDTGALWPLYVDLLFALERSERSLLQVARLTECADGPPARPTTPGTLIGAKRPRVRRMSERLRSSPGGRGMRVTVCRWSGQIRARRGGERSLGFSRMEHQSGTRLEPSTSKKSGSRRRGGPERAGSAAAPHWPEASVLMISPASTRLLDRS